MRNPRRAMTLLEVLIAIVVLVMAVSTILPLFAVGTASHKRGMDQAQMAWLAPRVAARLQERLYESGPRDVEGFVRPLEDGSLLIDTESDPRVKDDGTSAFRFKAKFTPMSGGGRDMLAGTAFVLKVELSTRQAGEPILETYDTLVLRKLLR